MACLSGATRDSCAVAAERAFLVRRRSTRRRYLADPTGQRLSGAAAPATTGVLGQAVTHRLAFAAIGRPHGRRGRLGWLPERVGEGGVDGRTEARRGG